MLETTEIYRPSCRHNRVNSCRDTCSSSSVVFQNFNKSMEELQFFDIEKYFNELATSAEHYVDDSREIDQDMKYLEDFDQKDLDMLAEEIEQFQNRNTISSRFDCDVIATEHAYTKSSLLEELLEKKSGRNNNLAVRYRTVDEEEKEEEDTRGNATNTQTLREIPWEEVADSTSDSVTSFNRRKTEDMAAASPKINMVSVVSILDDRDSEMTSNANNSNNDNNSDAIHFDDNRRIVHDRMTEKMEQTFTTTVKSVAALDENETETSDTDLIDVVSVFANSNMPTGLYEGKKFSEAVMRKYVLVSTANTSYDGYCILHQSSRSQQRTRLRGMFKDYLEYVKEFYANCEQNNSLMDERGQTMSPQQSYQCENRHLDHQHPGGSSVNCSGRRMITKVWYVAHRTNVDEFRRSKSFSNRANKHLSLLNLYEVIIPVSFKNFLSRLMNFTVDALKKQYCRQDYENGYDVSSCGSYARSGYQSRGGGKKSTRNYGETVKTFFKVLKRHNTIASCYDSCNTDTSNVPTDEIFTHFFEEVLSTRTFSFQRLPVHMLYRSK